jgi:hypothetical protein
MKKLLALLLALVMIFALAACGGNSNDDDDDKPSKKKGLEDKWSWVMSMDGEMMGLEDFDGEFSMTVLFDFDDGKYTITLDEKALDKSVKAFEQDMVDYMVEAGLDEASAREMVEEMDLAGTMAESMEDEMTESGTYTAEDGKLTMTNEDGDEEVYSYEIKGDKMTLIPEGEEGQDMLEALNLDAMELKRK